MITFPKTNAFTHHLPNGLTLILNPDASAPVISTQVWVGTGSIHEGPYLGAGISHLLEHFVFKGTKSWSSEELSQTVLGAGGQWNAYTTFDRTVYYIDGPAQSAKTFLQVLLEMIFSPTFPVDEFEREKDVIRREIAMGQDDPDNHASRQLFSSTFAQDYRRYPVIGHLDLFNKLTHEDMVNYHRSRYTTENTFVSIAGDFNQEEIISAIQDLTEGIERSFTIPAVPETQPKQQASTEIISEFAIPTCKLAMTWQAPSLDHPDSAALDVLSTILGSGRSSRLYQALRENEKLCHHIGSWSYSPSRLPGLFTVNAEVDNENIDTLKSRILIEIEKIGSEAIDKEIQKAKRMTLSAQIKTLTSASGIATDLASNWHESRCLDFTGEYLNKINAVTISDVRRVAAKWLNPDNPMTTSIIKPEGTGDADNQSNTKNSKNDITQHVLSNGIKLILRDDKRTPTVSIQAAVLTGLPSESTATQGINTLLASLLTKGTKSYSAKEIADRTESLGASIHASSGNNSTTVSASCLTPDLDTILEIMSECMITPSFDTDAIDREKQQLLNAIEEAELDPASLAFKSLRSQLFASSGYGLQSLGTKESVSNITRLSLVAHHKAHYNAANISIAIFGDIDVDSIIQTAEQFFGKIKDGARTEFPEQAFGVPKSIEISLDKQQAVLAIGFPGASVQDEDRYALAILHSWCSDMAGPLFSRIREELGLAYYVSSTMFHGVSGFFGFYMGTAPDQLDLATKELNETIKMIAENGMDTETLEKVKTSWLAKEALSNQSNGAMARLCVIDSVLGFDPLNYLITSQKVQRLTTDDVKRVAKRFLAQQEPHTITVTP